MSNSGFTIFQNEMALWSNKVYVFAEDRVWYCVEDLPSLSVYLYSEHTSTPHHTAEDKYYECAQQLHYTFQDPAKRPSSCC